MEKLTTLTGVAVPLRRSNVDTDQIIPAVFLKRVKKSGFDDALFYAWRRDPEFVLNKPEYKQGKILVWPARISALVPPASTPCGRCTITVSAW